MFELDEAILAAHLVSGVPWMPGAAMIKAVIDAGLNFRTGSMSPKTIVFDRVTFRDSYRPAAGRKARLSVALTGSDGKFAFEVRSGADDNERCLSDGEFELSQEPCRQTGHPGGQGITVGDETSLSSDEIYGALSGIGVDYLDVLRSVDRFSVEGPTATGRVRIRAPHQVSQDYSILAFDAIMQCALLLWASSGGKSTVVPFAFERAILPLEYSSVFTVLLQPSGLRDVGLTADISIYDEQGRQIGVIEGLILNALRATKDSGLDETPKMSITVSSFFTCQPLCQPLEEALAVNGESACVTEAAYGQVLQGLLHESAPPGDGDDVRLVLVRAEDFIPRSDHSTIDDTADDRPVRKSSLQLPTHKLLPNGMRIAQLNDYETDYLYHEIFECQAYRDDRVVLPNDAVIIDIGANIGMFSLSMASDLDGATIFAFEPSPQAYAALNENVKRFGGRVHAFNYGIGSNEQTARFTVYPNSSVFSTFAADLDADEAAVRKLIQNSLADKGLGDDMDAWVEHFMKDRMDAHTIECQLRPLSSVIDEHDIQFIDLLKIDAEKSEVAVLHGIRDEHWSRIRQVIIEVHDLTGTISDDIQNRLRQFGFEVVVRQETALEASGLFNLYAMNTTASAPDNEERTAFHKAKANIEMLVEAAALFQDRQSSVKVLISLCPPSPWAQRVLGSSWIQGIENYLVQRLADQRPDLAVLRAGDYLHVDPLDCVDALSAEIGDIPYKVEYFENLAAILAKRIVAFHRTPYKVLVLDCDNTLWGGACGELTPDQLDFGGPFLSFRRQLKDLVQAGYLLCLCSKNDPETVQEVFRARADSVLEWSDFVATAIGWGPKSQSIRTLSESLDLNLADFVFIDDNPVECAEVHANIPEVLVIQVPADGDFADGYYKGLWALRTHGATAEDASRTRLYRENVQRNALRKSSLSLQSFLEGLKLEVRLESIAPQDLPRAAQLTARTNQFNIHKQALTAEAIRDQIGMPETFGRLVHVLDRFGDYGITGLVLARREQSVISISTFLLSCRVLGKGVEERVLSMLADEFARLGIREVRFEYVQSKRNTPARNLLTRLDPDAVPQDGVPVEYRCTLGRLAAPLPVDGGISRAADVEAADPTPETGPGSQATLGRRPEMLRVALVELFARTLGMDRSQVDPAADFDRLGITSLQLIELTKAIDVLLGRVKRTILFEKQTIDALVDHFSTAVAEPPAPAATAKNHNAPCSTPSQEARMNELHQESGGRSPKMRSALKDTSRIAVVGMAGRFPMARDTRAFWKNLLAAKDCIGSTAERSILTSGAAIDHVPPHYTNAAGLIDGVNEFDAKFFGIPPEDAKLISPQQRLFLQEAWNALEDAGYQWKRGADEVGVFVGSMGDDYALAGQESVLSGGRMYADADIHEIANRTSYLFDFTGPSMAVDTACSSSLTALHLACNSLRLGECRSALVGGVNLISHPSRFTRYCDKELLSRRGATASFADDADGFVDGEGVGCIVLRPLQDALDDGNHIYGMVLGSAINSRGRSGGFHAPGAQSHRTVVAKAYQAAGISPGSVSYVEAQGAGSPLGDGLELEALGDVHQQGQKMAGSCVIGSLKPNIGHLEAAAGIAGVIKVLLQMTYGMITPMAASGRGVSAVALSASPFVVQHRPLTWVPEGDDPNVPGVRRAGVAAFGATGSNAFVVLEERPRHIASRSDRPEGSHVLDRVIVLSAHSEQALHGRVAQLNDVIRDPRTQDRSAGDPLARIAHTLQVGRRTLSHRLALVVTSLQDLAGQLDGIVRGDARSTSSPTLYRGTSSDHRHAAELNPIEARSLHRFVQHGDAAAIASLWASGADIDWSTLGRSDVPERLPMPGYPFERDGFWVSSAPSPVERAATPARESDGMSGSVVEQAIVDFVHARLGIDRDAVDHDKDLHGYGANSLFALRLVSHLNAEYDLNIKIHDIFDHFTVRGIASLIRRSKNQADLPKADVRPQPDAELIEQLERLVLGERNGI